MATTNKSEFKTDKEDLNREQYPEAKRETGGLSTEGAGWERSDAGEPGITTGGLSRIKGGKSGFEQAQTAVTDFAHKAGDKASAWAGDAKDIASQAGGNVATMIRRYPVASVFAGFGVGFLFAFLIPRRR